MPKLNHSRAVLLLMVCALIWSSSGLGIKLLSWGPLAILCSRSILAALVMLVYLRRPQFTFSRWQIVGALAYVGTQLFFIAGTQLTTAANAIFLQFTAPVYVALLGGWLLGERPRRIDWIAMVLIFIGMGFFFGDDLSMEGTYGNFLSVLAGISMAVMTIALREQRDESPGSMLLLGNIMAVVIGFPWLIQESFTLPNVSIILYLGIVQIGLTFVAFSIAVRHVEALESILILSLEPILNPIWVFLVIGEAAGRWASLGGIIVMVAILGRAYVGIQAERSQSSSIQSEHAKTEQLTHEQ